MRSVRTATVIALLSQLALLTALAVTIGLSGFGWLLGITCGVVTNVTLARALSRAGAAALGPADRVTLVRATLVGAVAALVVGSLGQPAPDALVAITVVALILDAVDGRVARRTGTVSAVGARFDMEVDAFLILVLSVYVVGLAGWWVLAIGLARYAFGLAGMLLPWMKAPSPPRYWCKVVAAVQGVVLTVAMADILPRAWAQAALAVALTLLAESFGREVSWLWRHRLDEPGPLPVVVSPASGRVRAVVAGGASVAALVLVWAALVAPNEIGQVRPSVLVRIPIELLVFVLLLLLLPARARVVVAAFGGLFLGLLTIVKVIDMGFFEVLDRPFNPVTDRSYFAPALGVLSDSVGKHAASEIEIVAAVLVVVIPVLMTLAVVRLSGLVSRHQGASIRTVGVLGVAWVLCAAFGAQLVSGSPVASSTAAGLAYDQVLQVRDGIQDEQSFAKAVADDPYHDASGSQLLTGLRGKDVIVAFVESYGRVAVQGSSFSPQVDKVLDAGTKRLDAAGFASESAFLTSPTFGGISWLAHSTLQTGLWVDNQQRYDQVVASNRFTLSDAFNRAGWRTVGDVPANRHPWKEGTSFYHYDKLYNEFDVGYHGPKFSYATIPDQYTMAAIQHNELAKAHRPPVMAEIDLVSSHTPWAPLPHLVPWSELGDGSVFDPMPAQGAQPDVVWRSAERVQAGYGKSIEYSLNSLVSFVQRYDDKNLVLILLGDHQPATIVSGEGASHDVPITIVAHDPAVMHQISGWHWQDGMLPGPQAPVWPMNAFRDRFLSAYSSGVEPTSQATASGPNKP